MEAWMIGSISDERLTWIEAGTGLRDDFARAVRDGLTRRPKALPCRWLYDERGSLLFERICELPEYYLTRAETEILRAHADELAARTAAGTSLVELGSGSARKTRLLVEALLARHGRLRYLPVDISRSMLRTSALALLGDYPGLEVTAVAAEYRAGLRALRDDGTRKLILWLGSNVGNFARDDAARFLQRLSAQLSADDRLLVGIDLRKPRLELERAYDDAAGVTARFNLNLLERINRELGGRFDLTAFRHQARYDDVAGRVDLALVSERDQEVTVGALGLTCTFVSGEALHTESSHKYSLDEIDGLAHAANLAVEAQWLDSRRRFSLNLLAPWSA
jgi:dimethylhistidine N-methyltransferase